MLEYYIDLRIFVIVVHVCLAVLLSLLSSLLWMIVHVGSATAVMLVAAPGRLDIRGMDPAYMFHQVIIGVKGLAAGITSQKYAELFQRLMVN